MPYLFRILTAIALLAAVSGSLARPDPLEAQRKLFLEARQALNANQLAVYRKLARQLEDYPLYSYLQFWELRNRLSSASEKEITRFLDTYADQLVSDRLKTSWLYNLARHQRWRLYLKYYRPSTSVDLQCYALQARLNTGRKQGLAEDILPLWLVGQSQPKACDPLFKYLYDGDYITSDLLWQRIRLAMENSRTSLAGYLARRLTEEDEAWVTLWRQAHSSPSSTLKSARLQRDIPVVREIIVHAMRRLALSNAESAHEKWQAIRSKYSFSDQQAGALERYIALRSATQDRPQAHDWLVAIPEGHQDQTIRDWQIRKALDEHKWPAALDHISALPAGERDTDEWRYWQAVTLEKTGQRQEAMKQYTDLARERSYHGFLAADYLQWPHEMGDTPLEFDTRVLAELGRQPGVLRAHELYRARLLSDARREWAHATRNLSREELKLAAILARQWGWNDRAILTVAQSGDYADLKLRFPLDYEDRVRLHAENNDLDPSHVFAVIRQESAFNKDARSPAGAMGLMQLMPGTGKVTARKNRIPLSGTRNLFDADKNIHIGTSYLRQVMDRYDNNPVLATASYNAGPHRVQRWLPDTGSQSAPVWIANIPFKETRKYVQRVLAYTAIYDWRMERPVIPLDKRMPTVQDDSRYQQTRVADL